MATNYEKGRRKEYKLCRELREEGFDIVQRTAGSHSPIDIIAIDKAMGIIRLIQSKPDNLPESAVRKLYRENQDLNGEFVVVFQVK